MEIFQSYVAIEFDSLTDFKLKQWLASKISASKEKYGAELLTKFSGNGKNEDAYLEIGASGERLLKGAEELSLKKKYKDNTYREFLYKDLENFLSDDNDSFVLSQSEILKVIEHELNQLKIDEEVLVLPSVGEIILHKFDSILHQFKKKGLIKDIFPIHDNNTLKELENKWYKNTASYNLTEHIPTDMINRYFGEAIGFYFSFFEFYTSALFPVALVGFFTWILPFSTFSKFAMCGVFNLLWSTIFMELWKRKSSHLSYVWGNFDNEIFEVQRSDFYGENGINPITGQPDFVYSKKKRMLKKYLVSYPCIAISVFFAFSLMMTYYHFQNNFDVAYPKDNYTHKILRLLPSIVYSFIVIPLNIIYKYAATWLTEWENHRTQSVFESNLTTKLFVFYFANSFMSLFYEAFFNRNFNNLSNLLLSLVVVNAIVNKIGEVLAPYLKKKIKKKILNFSEKFNISTSASNIEKQAYTLDEYEGTYSDYVTIFEQYGYIALFSAVFPWISIAALINNIMEQRSDAFKYCHVYKRPFPRNASGIGPWSIAFEILNLVAVLTNISLISIHPDVRNYFSNYTDKEYVILFVVAEHLLIIIKVIIMFVIPDESNAVTQAKTKYKYDSIQALKTERLLRAAKTK